MRTTYFHAGDEGVRTEADEPELAPLTEFDGRPLEGVRSVDLATVGDLQPQIVEIAAGGHFAMHSSPDVAFCQIVRGAGRLGLPDGRELTYDGPQLYIFLPDTEHDWHAVAEDTLLSVCLIPATAAGL